MISSKAVQIYNAARFNGFSETMARFIVAQAAHETAGFTSFIYINNNNAFGMKFAGQATAAGEKNGYAWYNSVEQSVSDLARWYGRKAGSLINLLLPIDTIDKYVNFLKANNYFEDSTANYIKGVKYWFNKIFNAE